MLNWLFSNFSRCSSDFAKEIEAELRKSLENLADNPDDEKDKISQSSSRVSEDTKFYTGWPIKIKPHRNLYTKECVKMRAWQQ